MEGLGIIAIRPRHLEANDGDSVALELIVERDQNLRARSADVGGRMDCVWIPPMPNSVRRDAELDAPAEFRKHLFPTTWCQMRAPPRQPCRNRSLSAPCMTGFI